MEDVKHKDAKFEVECDGCTLEFSTMMPAIDQYRALVAEGKTPEFFVVTRTPVKF